LVDQELPDGPNQIPAAPALQIRQKVKQHRLVLTGSILDVDQVPGFIQQLQEMIQGLPQASALEMLRGAFRDAKKSDVSYRYAPDLLDMFLLSV
jgi:hypothetical protein